MKYSEFSIIEVFFIGGVIPEINTPIQKVSYIFISSLISKLSFILGLFISIQFIISRESLISSFKFKLSSCSFLGCSI